MKLIKFVPFIVALMLLGNVSMSQASIGDTSTVFSHWNYTVVTDPGAGSHPYPSWAVFADTSVKYRKVILHINYKCPPGMACGEWDYLDYVYLRRVGGVNAPSKDIEIARFITPYGNGMTSAWHSEFHMDITDYALFLHDSVEVEYRHDGYETTAKGWLVNMYFEFIEGTPVMEPIKFTQLWNGSMPFGYSGNPIENYLQPDTIVATGNTKTMRMRILQSGHGSDNNGCSEFCSKTRTLYLNGNILGQRSIWRTNCGLTPIYPQGGTWIYSRGNWCPGSWVFPDFYEATVNGGSSNIFDMNMQSYTSTNPSARYAVNAQLIEYGPSTHVNDASIEEVYSPNSMFEYSRMNPICDNAKINIRNNGSAAITSATIKYGIEGMPQSTYNWVGNLAKNKAVDVVLGDVLPTYPSYQTFKAYIATVNGVADEYNYDDTAKTMVNIPPMYDSVMIFVFKTNNQPTQNNYTLKNTAGTTLYSRTTGLTANTTYRDTFRLAPGCYRFTFNDTGNDGLSWWANTAGGSGTAKFSKLTSPNFKVFNPDFGSQIFQAFTVGSNPLSIQKNAAKEVSLDIFPNPTLGPLNMEIQLPIAEDFKLEVYNGMGQKILEKNYVKSDYQMLEFDFSKFESGMYYAKITSNHYTATKEIVVSK
ncbi:MAG: T9SS type A sorting domain-containing protein [Bacteroidetes bacterium]|nr:T9SS type A sorting domain-containing protein [Bacteroidota bacterium]